MNTLVLGGAVSGRAAARLARRLGHDVTVYDRDPSVTPLLRRDRIAVTTGTWTSQLVEGRDLVVASPGFSEASEPIADSIAYGVPLWSELEFSSRHLDAPMIAVTGTNGKTTVTGVIASMLRRDGVEASAAGNIGTALADLVMVADRAPQIIVVEASSFQLRFTEALHPSTAVLLNVAPDHLDWHGSFEAYLESKTNVFRNQVGDEALIYDADDEGARRAVASARGRLVPVSGSRRPRGGAGVTSGKLDLGEVVLPLDRILVSDPAFLVDLAAAGVAALEHGVHPAAVEEIIVGFRPGEHRRTVVGEWDGVVWVDDSKATNPHAALASIRAYPSVVLIAGGRNKGLELRPLASAANVRELIALGEAASELLEACEPGKGVRAETMQQAVALADEVAVRGDTVLLAPGCASFDMFRSYADRGESFAATTRRRKDGR